MNTKTDVKCANTTGHKRKVTPQGIETPHEMLRLSMNEVDGRFNQKAFCFELTHEH